MRSSPRSKSATNTPARTAGSSHRQPPGAGDGLAVVAAVAGSSRGNALASTAESAAATTRPPLAAAMPRSAAALSSASLCHTITSTGKASVTAWLEMSSPSDSTSSRLPALPPAARTADSAAR